MASTEPRLVEIGGIEYQETPCASCDENGQRYDPTLVGNIHTGGSGLIRCPHCEGQRVIRKITRRGMDQEQQRFEARRTAAQNQRGPIR